MAAHLLSIESGMANNALQWDVPAFGGAAPEHGR